MGMIATILGALFGGGRNVIRQTAEVFRPNAEKSAQRAANYQGAALQQFSAEFRDQRGWFDRLIDGLNRLPRPAMALGTIGLFVSAMWNPVWFAERMQGLALVPDQMWWLLGAIVTFYFGARYQAKSIDAKRILRQTPTVVDNIAALGALSEGSPRLTDDQSSADHNQAVEDFKAGK